MRAAPQRDVVGLLGVEVVLDQQLDDVTSVAQAAQRLGGQGQLGPQSQQRVETVLDPGHLLVTVLAQQLVEAHVVLGVAEHRQLEQVGEHVGRRAVEGGPPARPPDGGEPAPQWCERTRVGAQRPRVPGQRGGWVDPMIGEHWSSSCRRLVERTGVSPRRRPAPCGGQTDRNSSSAKCD
ncbi:hypothetical protein [Nocardioides sp. TF02-7]|uniref:hypothetical protein n=1 Tax=Nocardioides sp. TF02-7 TaxID=2917724 RepID=UPI001F069CB9|nr:hypothetical protein [Nocardioides sp. TF02-7]UMG94980.1 hypothetical protein MF408_15925 [Nocardioides sp. TF02-7]